jgi:vancomycin resistance protein VanW
MEYWGGYSRHNEIWRKTFDVETGEMMEDEFLTDNHAIMMYEPLLSAPEPARA